MRRIRPSEELCHIEQNTLLNETSADNRRYLFRIDLDQASSCALAPKDTGRESLGLSRTILSLA